MNLVRPRRKATNRVTYHQQLIRTAPTPRVSLRRAVEWLMSEAHHGNIPSLIKEVTALSVRENERSRQ